jgi:hypothetical protein
MTGVKEAQFFDTNIIRRSVMTAVSISNKSAMVKVAKRTLRETSMTGKSGW